MALAREGMRLGLTGRDGVALEKLATQARAAGAPDVGVSCGDLIDGKCLKAAIDATAARFGGIDCLVNNVGGPETDFRPKGFLDLDDAAWQRSFEKVLLIAVRTCRQ